MGNQKSQNKVSPSPKRRDEVYQSPNGKDKVYQSPNGRDKVYQSPKSKEKVYPLQKTQSFAAVPDKQKDKSTVLPRHNETGLYLLKARSTESFSATTKTAVIEQFTLDRALTNAVKSGIKDTIEDLLIRGANSKSILYSPSVLSRGLPIFELLYSYTENPNNFRLINDILSNINEDTYEDRTTILEHFQLCKFIMKQDPTIMDDEDFYKMIIKKACRFGGFGIVKTCVEYGCKFDFEEGILLMLAVRYNHKLMSDYLIKETNVLNTPNFSFKDLLECATRHNNTDVMDLCQDKLRVRDIS